MMLTLFDQETLMRNHDASVERRGREAGKAEGKAEPVIQISIMDHSLFPDHKKFFNEYIPRDKEGYPYTDKLKFLVMDLTQIEEASQEQKDQGLVEWAKAFRANSWEEVNR